jgi:hypothetical protein
MLREKPPEEESVPAGTRMQLTFTLTMPDGSSETTVFHTLAADDRTTGVLAVEHDDFEIAPIRQGQAYIEREPDKYLTLRITRARMLPTEDGSPSYTTTRREKEQAHG